MVKIISQLLPLLDHFVNSDSIKSNQEVVDVGAARAVNAYRLLKIDEMPVEPWGIVAMFNFESLKDTFECFFLFGQFELINIPGALSAPGLKEK